MEFDNYQFNVKGTANITKKVFLSLSDCLFVLFTYVLLVFEIIIRGYSRN